jgi:uncharacterized protein (TIGR02118 family)
MTHRLVFVLYRRPELSREEFQHYWSTTHAPLVRSVADVLGIERYQQVHTVAEDPSYTALAFDGVAELWFDLSRSTASPEEQLRASLALLEDERKFIALSASPIFVGEEKPMIDGPRDGLRLTGAIYRKPGTTRAEFRRYWSDVHGPLAMANAGVFDTTRYVQVHAPDNAEAFPPALARHAPEPLDGLGETHFTNLDPDPALAEQILAELAADTAKFADTDRTVATFGRVDVIIGT